MRYLLKQNIILLGTPVIVELKAMRLTHIIRVVIIEIIIKGIGEALSNSKVQQDRYHNINISNNANNLC